MNVVCKPLAAGLLVGIVAGCAAEKPMATDGPNQVVIKVPGMS
jgi:hypothetical protein